MASNPHFLRCYHQVSLEVFFSRMLCNKTEFGFLEVLGFFLCSLFLCLVKWESHSSRPSLSWMSVLHIHLYTWLIPQTGSCVIQVLPNERWLAGVTAVSLISQSFNKNCFIHKLDWFNALTYIPYAFFFYIYINIVSTILVTIVNPCQC